MDENEREAIKEGVPDPPTHEEKLLSEKEEMTEEKEQSINDNTPVEHQASLFQRFVRFIFWIAHHFF